MTPPADDKPRLEIRGNAPPVLQRALDTYIEYFEERPLVAARAPGRINLVGDHADDGEGYVLSVAIDRNVVMVGRTNRSPRCRVVASDLGGEMANFMNTGDLDQSRTPWVNLVKGIVAQFNANGHRVPSFDAVIASDVPIGAGLGGSTAVQVAAATFIEAMLGIRLTSSRKAHWTLASREAFGTRPGSAVDALICCAAHRKHALRIDSRSHEYVTAPLSRADVTVLVTDTGTHRDDDPPAERRREVAEATAIMQQQTPHIQALRDVTLTQVEQTRDALGETLTKRARHIVLESQRVMMVADALQRDDYATVGFLMYESHRSLRDQFEVSTDELDALVELTMKVDGVYGAKMTGPGFGGCTVTLVRTEAAAALIERLTAGFEAKFGRPCVCHRVIPVAGAKAVPIVPLHGQ
jgi:galactokinase